MWCFLPDTNRLNWCGVKQSAAIFLWGLTSFCLVAPSGRHSFKQAEDTEGFSICSFITQSSPSTWPNRGASPLLTGGLPSFGFLCCGLVLTFCLLTPPSTPTHLVALAAASVAAPATEAEPSPERGRCGFCAWLSAVPSAPLLPALFPANSAGWLLHPPCSHA
ncbi:hypothetical protein MRX96_017473 [Rhipicephalus microplus]